MQYTGYVKWYNEARGYGFITSESTKQDYFVHVKSMYNFISLLKHPGVKGYSPETFIDLKPHTRVKFKIEAKRPGKQSEAIDVEVMKE